MTLRRINLEGIPTALTGTILCSSNGYPRPCAMLWLSLNKHKYSEKHERNHLRAISLLYEHNLILRGKDNLDSLLFNWNFDQIEELLTSYLGKVQNKSAQTGVDYSESWKMALDFVTTISHQTNHRLKRDTYRLSQIRADLQNLERLYKYLQPTKKNKIARVRSLPSSVVEEILAMLAPNDETNPFRNKKTQWRNFTISLLLLHQGLRRGEIASLRADCLRHEYSSAENKDIYWLNVRQAELFDTRFDKPQIKNSQSERQIPVSNSLAKVVIHYIQNWRGRCKHGFLFGSSHGNPLSNRSFNYIFECVSGALSDIAREELYHKIQQKNVTLHNFRHTCAVVRLHNFMERNIEMALAEQLMREFFGWSKESQMPRRYAKAFYNTKLQDIWNDEFDERFESIHLTRSPLAEQTKNLETTISGAEHRPHLR